MPNSIPASSDVRLFADDTSIIIHNQDIYTLMQDASSDLALIQDWFNLNKLCLSLNKSCFLIFRGVKKPNLSQIKTISVGEESISRAATAKYVGLTLDETLNWEAHIAELCNSLVKYFSVFYNIRHLINKKLARTIYFAGIYCRIKYGIEIYGAASACKMNRLQTLQNRLLKTLLCKQPLYGTDQLHSELNILKVCDIHNCSVLQFVYNCINEPIPALQTYYTRQNEMHNHDTRFRESISINRYRTELGRSTTHNRGAKLWNDLDSSITNAKTQKEFKNLIERWYKSSYS